MTVFFILFCAILVILMQLGFALLEAGLLSSKHTISIIFKNFADFGVGFIAFFSIGYWILNGFTLHPYSIINSEPTNIENAINLVDFLYQSAFATTAATICSGAIAGRMRLFDYLIISTLISGFIYPISGWILWSVLEEVFKDYAGSIVVHATGGAAALAATLLIGRRPSQERTLPPHNIILTTTGGFLLLIGWYGFNMGSTELSIETAKGLHEIGVVAINTTLAATVSMSVTIFFGWWNKIPRITITINGLLGGLVGITASPDVTMIWYPFLIGGFCGWLVFTYSAHIIRNKYSRDLIDDPVGAIIVHLGCGVIGGIGVSFIKWSEGDKYFWSQIVISLLTPLIIFIIFIPFLVIMHTIFKRGNERFRRYPTGIQKYFGILNRLQCESTDIERGLDLANHQETAYDIPGPLETPRVFSDRINGLFIQYIQPELSMSVNNDNFYPLVDRGKEYFSYEIAAISRDIPDEMNTQQRASFVPFSAPLRLWLDDALAIVKRYFKLYGNIVVPDNITLENIPYSSRIDGRTVIDVEQLVINFERAINRLEQYHFIEVDNRRDFFNTTMQEVLQILFIIKRITISHDNSTRN